MPRAIRAALYARVSTQGQSTKAQEAELNRYASVRGWAIQQTYVDKMSGAKDHRPALQQLMADCRRRKVDVVVVWKFDRFARSLRHLVTALEEFRRLGVNFISATEGVDTTVPSGELVFQIFGAIAQFERSLISERVKAGLSEARRNGRRLGRPANKELSALEISVIRKERRKGATLRQIAKRHGASVWAVQQACSK